MPCANGRRVGSLISRSRHPWSCRPLPTALGHIGMLCHAPGAAGPISSRFETRTTKTPPEDRLGRGCSPDKTRPWGLLWRNNENQASIDERQTMLERKAALWVSKSRWAAPAPPLSWSQCPGAEVVSALSTFLTFLILFAHDLIGFRIATRLDPAIGAWENQMEALRRYTQDPDVREILIGSAGILIFAIFLVCVVQ